MERIDFTKIIPAFDYSEGGEIFANYMKLYEDFINDVVQSNEEILNVFDCRTCDSKYLPYLSAFLGESWDYEGDTENQRYKLLSLVERRKRIGSMWFFEDMFKNAGVTVEIKNLVHHVLTLSGSEPISDDYCLEDAMKYHEGSVEMIVHHAEIAGLEELIKASIPAGVHLHVTYTLL